MANFFQASTKKQSLGQVITVNVQRLDLNGCGVALYQNKPVFIAGALPGESVNVKIIEQKSKFLKATLLNIENINSTRIDPFCPHYTLCGGCDLQHLHFDEHLFFKQKKVSELFERNNIEGALPWEEAIVSAPRNYRRKARIGVQYDKKGQVILGFRQKSTNQLTSIKKCEVLVESLSSVFIPLKKVLNQLSLSQSVGHVEVVATDSVSLIVRQLKPINSVDSDLWHQAAAKNNWQIFMDDGENITSLTPVQNLSYQLPNNIELTFDVKDFIQVNHQVNTQMVIKAIDWLSLSPTDVVLDLFCGLGNFSLSIAKQVKSVIGVEGVQTMVNRATINAQNNHLDNCEFFQANLNSNWLEELWTKSLFDKTINKVILDPARAGALEAIEQLIKFSVNDILYVSCDPATLARDAQQLIAHGYKIKKIALMDMFAQTKHVETMVLFSRL